MLVNDGESWLIMVNNHWLVISNMAFTFHFISFPLTFMFLKMVKTTDQPIAGWFIRENPSING